MDDFEKYIVENKHLFDEHNADKSKSGMKLNLT